jgi:hypothetical protein
MRQEQATSSSALFRIGGGCNLLRTWWHGRPLPLRRTIVCTVAILTCTAVAIGATVWDATDDALGPEHPLPMARLGLRLVTLLATAVALAIGAIVTFRMARDATRLREGLCLKCGYDLRAATDRCPECGRPVPARPAV